MLQCPTQRGRIPTTLEQQLLSSASSVPVLSIAAVFVFINIILELFLGFTLFNHFACNCCIATALIFILFLFKLSSLTIGKKRRNSVGTLWHLVLFCSESLSIALEEVFGPTWLVHEWWSRHSICPEAISDPMFKPFYPHHFLESTRLQIIVNSSSHKS